MIFSAGGGGGGGGGEGVVCTFVVCMQQGKLFSRRGRLIVNIFKICFYNDEIFCSFSSKTDHLASSAL